MTYFNNLKLFTAALIMVFITLFVIISIVTAIWLAVLDHYIGLLLIGTIFIIPAYESLFNKSEYLLGVEY